MNKCTFKNTLGMQTRLNLCGQNGCKNTMRVRLISSTEVLLSNLADSFLAFCYFGMQLKQANIL